MFSRSLAAPPFSGVPIPKDVLPSTAIGLSKQPHVHLPPRVPHSCRTPNPPEVPIQQVPHQLGHLAPQVPPLWRLTHRCLPPPVPAYPSLTPLLLTSGPSPARRVPELHRLHGAAGSRPDPLTASSSPGTSLSRPRRPSHTSAFRPYRKRCEARGAGRSREDLA